MVKIKDVPMYSIFRLGADSGRYVMLNGCILTLDGLSEGTVWKPSNAILGVSVKIIGEMRPIYT